MVAYTLATNQVDKGLKKIYPVFPPGIPPNKMKKLFTKTTPSFGARYLLRAEKYSLLYLFTKSDANIRQKGVFKQVFT